MFQGPHIVITTESTRSRRWERWRKHLKHDMIFFIGTLRTRCYTARLNRRASHRHRTIGCRPEVVRRASQDAPRFHDSFQDMRPSCWFLDPISP
jgi:hypothetical protein